MVASWMQADVFSADINECVERPTVCRANQECRNTVGSYTCHNLITCSAGYQLNDEGSRCEGGSRILAFFKKLADCLINSSALPANP